MTYKRVLQEMFVKFQVLPTFPKTFYTSKTLSLRGIQNVLMTPVRI